MKRINSNQFKVLLENFKVNPLKFKGQQFMVLDHITLENINSLPDLNIIFNKSFSIKNSNIESFNYQVNENLTITKCNIKEISKNALIKGDININQSTINYINNKPQNNVYISGCSDIERIPPSFPFDLTIENTNIPVLQVSAPNLVLDNTKTKALNIISNSCTIRNNESSSIKGSIQSLTCINNNDLNIDISKNSSMYIAKSKNIALNCNTSELTILDTEGLSITKNSSTINTSIISSKFNTINHTITNRLNILQSKGYTIGSNVDAKFITITSSELIKLEANAQKAILKDISNNITIYKDRIKSLELENCPDVRYKANKQNIDSLIL